MTLDAAEFICRSLTHVLPSGFHRVLHHGRIASAVRARNVERARDLLATQTSRWRNLSSNFLGAE